MGLGALWDPNLHPRGWHGRFVKKFKLAPWLDKVLKDFSPRQFQSNNQAAQYALNQGHKSPGGAFSPEDIKRIHLDWDEAQDALRAGKIDPTTQKFVDAMSRHMQPAPEGLILSKTFGPEALGLRPEQLNTNADDPNSILHQIGNTITDRGFSATHLGTNDSHGPGKITMTIAAPPGTKVAFSGVGQTDRGVFMDRDQKLLVTHVDPDGRGGWYMMAVAEPQGATTGSPQTLVPGRKGAGLSEVQREARVGGPSATAPKIAEPPSATPSQATITPTTSVEPGQAPTPTPAKKAARAARQAGYQQARANEAAGVPQAAPQPQPVAPTPGPPAPASVGARTEPVHGPIGGTPTEGKSASEIANVPPAPPPAPAPPTPNNGATFKQEFHSRGLQSPSAGPQRREFNNAYLGVTGGKLDPQDGLRELDADIEHNKGLAKNLGPNDPKAAELKTNIQRQEELANLIAEHFNLPRTHKTPEAAPAPVTEATKVAKAVPSAPSVPSGRPSYAERKSPGTAAGKITAGRLQEGDQVLVTKNAKGEWVPATKKTGASLVTLGKYEPGSGQVRGKLDSGEEIRLVNVRNHQTYFHGPERGAVAKVAKAATPEAAPAPEKKAGGFATVKNLSPEERKAYDALNTSDKSKYLARRRAGQSHEQALGAKVAKAAPAKAAPVKAAKAAAPAAPKAVSEVQTRADAAGLPKTVTALRAQAREKKIRGFSTMSKEQLQRALLGEEVPSAAKVLVSPEKLGPHIQAAPTENAAKALLTDHTLKDLRDLGKANGVDLKGKRTKPQVEDAILKHLRGEEPTGLKPVKVTESLDSELKKANVVAPDGPEGAGIRKALSEVDPNDPQSLRTERDNLEKEASRLRAAGDRPAATLAQGAADVLGMRAQRISGVEEAAPAKKVAKVAPPTGHEDLGGTKASLLEIAAKEGAPHKQAMTKPQLIKAITDHRAGKPAPVKMAAKKAAPPAGELHLGEGRGAAGRLAGTERIKPSGEVGPVATEPARAAKVQAPPVAREGLVPSGQTGPQKSAPGAPAPAKRTPAEKAIGRKVVPEGSVKGDRAQVPIDNKPRASEFDQAWDKAGIPTAPDKTSQGSIDEIRRDVSKGSITPEEGIRRLESDISLNHDEINDINRTIRSGDVQGAELDKLRTQRDRLITSVSAQEDASRFMHQHFGKERVTPEEVKAKITETQGQKFWDELNKADPEALRQEIASSPELKHLGPIEGNTPQEVFQDALKKVIKGELEKRAAKKAAKAAPRAVPGPKPEFAPGGAKHLDVKAIGEGLNIDNETLSRAQADLNSGKTPGQVAKDLERFAEARRTSGVFLHGGWHGERQGPDAAQRNAEDAAKLEEIRAQADQIDELAKRLKSTRRPIVRKAAPAKAAEEHIAEAQKATRSPAAKKALGNAETAVKSAGAEADALKARIIKRHSDAWDGADTREKAQAAADAMRGDLTLAEIRQWAAPQGITGRSKEDILKKAVDRKFGEGAPQEPKLSAVESRMARASRARAVARSLADIEELKANQASANAVSHRIKSFGKSGNLPEPLIERIHAAGTTGNEAELNKIAKEHGLTRMADQAGTVVPYNPRVHDEIGTPGVREGQPVRVISPGYQGTVDGREFTAIKARVQHEPEVRARKIAAAERLRPKNVAPEPTLPAAGSPEEKAANLARLQAAKAAPAAVKESPADVFKRLNSFESPPSREEAHAAIKDMTKAELVDMAKRANIPGASGKTKENLRAEIVQATVGRRLDSAATRGFTGARPGQEVAAPSPALRKAAAAGAAEGARSGGSSPVKAAEIKAAKKATPSAEVTPPRNMDAALARERAATNAPVKTGHIRDFGPGLVERLGRSNGDEPLKLPNGGADQGAIHMDSQIGQLWQDLASDPRTSNSTLNRIDEIGTDLGRGKIDLPTARALIRDIKPGNAEVRQRINNAVASLDVKPTKYEVPDNVPKEVRDILDRINEVPAYHNKAPGQAGEGPTPFEQILGIIRDISSGKEGPGGDMKLVHAIQNPHESGDGVYAARRLAHPLNPGPGQSAEIRNWFRSWRAKEQAPSTPTPAPAKKATKAVKAAPQPTRAELRNPVPKAGTAAPVKATAPVQAHGLTEGDGIPISNRLALEGKLSNRSTLNAMDRAVRHEATRNKVPELFQTLMTQLSQAGVGPNDEPRKSLIAWYEKHFS